MTEQERPTNESCANCRRRLKLSKWDYSDTKNKGVQEEDMYGYVCMAFADEGVAVWMVGEDDKYGMCELWEEKQRPHGIRAQ